MPSFSGSETGRLSARNLCSSRNNQDKITHWHSNALAKVLLCIASRNRSCGSEAAERLSYLIYLPNTVAVAGLSLTPSYSAMIWRRVDGHMVLGYVIEIEGSCIVRKTGLAWEGSFEFCHLYFKELDDFCIVETSAAYEHYLDPWSDVLIDLFAYSICRDGRCSSSSDSCQSGRSPSLFNCIHLALTNCQNHSLLTDGGTILGTYRTSSSRVQNVLRVFTIF